MVVLAGMAWSAQAQSNPAPESQQSSAPILQREDVPPPVTLRAFPKNFLEDQKNLLTTPVHMRAREWRIAVPIGLLAAGLVASDTAVEAHVTRNSSTVSKASTFSNAGVAVLLAGSGAMYLQGLRKDSEPLRETGLLSGEAALDAYLDTTVIKYIAGRQLPFTSSGQGHFFKGGSSFPSRHAAVSWAIASVIAHEYPGTMTKVLSYGLASAVSVARVEAHQHFMSDVAIGGALGWYIGRQVYRSHSPDAEIDPHKFGTFERDEGSEREDAVSKMASSYLPLDSWVYDAIERLAAMGYVQSSSMLIRPWTRLEASRLLEEARTQDAEQSTTALPLLNALDAELEHETGLAGAGNNHAAQLEDLYARYTGIAGEPLRDSFHFAQTLVDDNGRPYGRGANAIAGITSHAEAGPLAFYVRGEYQYASSISPYNDQAQQALAAYDGLPYGWNLRSGATRRFRPVEAYVALRTPGWQLSFGQQSLWWGPNRESSMILSNNAEAMPMIRLTRVRPATLPGFLSGLGPIHSDWFFAREGGIHYLRLGQPFQLYGDAQHAITPPPYIWGGSFSINPTSNLEIGFAHTTIFAGYGRPLNLKTFLHSFSILGNRQEIEPGKRTSEISFSYHVPGLRNWLVVYSEAFAYDNPVEGKFLARFAISPGIYLPKFPGLNKLDLRVEGTNTNLPKLKDPSYFYSNGHYAQGYTHYGQIFGSWVGRQGTGVTAASNYWFTAQNKATVRYRHMSADKSYLSGGSLDDFSGSLTWRVRPQVEFSVMSQYERWKFPLLDPGPRSDVSTSLGVRFYPRLRTGAE